MLGALRLCVCMCMCARARTRTHWGLEHKAPAGRGTATRGAGHVQKQLCSTHGGQ